MARDLEPVCRVWGKYTRAPVCPCCEHHGLREGFTWETGGRGAEMKVAAKSSCSCSKPKSLQLFSGLTDFTTGLQSKTVHSQTVILHIPGFGAHTRLWSHRSVHEQKDFFFFLHLKQAQFALLEVHRCTMTHFCWLLYKTFERLVWRRSGRAKLN